MAMSLLHDRSASVVALRKSSCLISNRRTKCEMVQNRNRMVAADSSALIMFTI